MNMNNGWLPKAISLIAAIVLWIFVMNEQNPLTERTISVPVSIQNLNSDHQVVMNQVQNIQVKIRAPRLQLSEFKDRDLSAVVDLKGASAGTHSLTVKLSAPRGVEIIETSAQSVEVVLDDLVTQQIPIEVEIDGKAAEGIQIQSTKVDPGFLTVTGPASEKMFAEKARVVINVADIHGSTIIEAVPVFGDRTKLSSNWTQSPAKVAVAIIVAPKESKSIGVRLQSKGTLPDGITLGNIQIDPATVNIRGNSAALSKVDFINTVSLDYSKIRENQEVTIGLEIPSGIVADQEKVRVTIQVRK